MAKKLDKTLKELEKDIIYFLTMCTNNDLKLYISDPKEKKIEDFARFACLGLAFNLRGVHLNVYAQYENVGDINDLLNYLDAVSFERAEKWIENFIINIKEPILKNCAQSIWADKKIYFASHKFEISKLF